MSFWFFKKREDIHGKVHKLERGVSDSFVNLKKDMDKISGWIDHFKNKHDHHDRRLNAIEQRLNELYEIINADNIDEHAEEIECVQSFNRSDASFMNVQSLENLTPAQKQVLILLSYAGGPLDYEAISAKLRLNIITIRRHINDLKRLGIPIIEKVSVRNRRKVFLLSKKVREIIVGEDTPKIKTSKKVKSES